MSHSWSLWGSEDEAVDEKIDEAVKDLVEEVQSQDAINNIDDVIDKSEKEANQEENTMTIEEIHQLNKAEFENKMKEAIRAHESIHLNSDSHVDDHGEHNAEFDHQAFLGDEAKEFRNLTPEESKEKLGKIAVKIDTNKDSLIDVEELTNWIKETQNRSIVR